MKKTGYTIIVLYIDDFLMSCSVFSIVTINIDGDGG